MAASQTTRLAIYTWTAGTDTFTRDQMTTSHTNIEARVAGYSQAGSRPAAAAAYQGFFHYSSTDSTAGVLSYSNGTAWFDIGSLSSSTPTPLDGSGSSGSAQSGARSDHKHAIANDAITSAMLNSADGAEAVTADVIRDDAVTTDAILAGSVTLPKIVDATGGYRIIAKADSGSGDWAELVAGNDTVLRKDGSNNLAFGTIDTNQIANDAVTDAKLDSTDGSEAVVTNVIRDDAVTSAKLNSTTDAEAVTTDVIRDDAVTLAKLFHASNGQTIIAKLVRFWRWSFYGEIRALNGEVLRRKDDDLEFGEINGTLGIENGTITDAKLKQTAGSQAVTKATIRNDAVGNDQLDYDEIQLYGKSTSATPAGHKIYAKTQSPTDAGISGTEGDIYLQYTT